MILNLSKASEAVIRLVFPEECVICKHTLSLSNRYLCPRCQTKTRQQLLPPLAALMPKQPGFADHIWSLYAYQGLIKGLITEIKFHQNPGLLQPLIDLAKPLTEIIFSETDYDDVLCIPTSPFKKIERFFNPAEEIMLLLKKNRRININTSFLKKKWGVPSQMQLNQQERLANLFGAFKMVGSINGRMQNVLIIDDIYTTGATVNEAARILKNAGAGRVDILTLARTVTQTNESLK